MIHEADNNDKRKRITPTSSLSTNSYSALSFSDNKKKTVHARTFIFIRHQQQQQQQKASLTARLTLFTQLWRNVFKPSKKQNQFSRIMSNCEQKRMIRLERNGNRFRSSY